MNHIRDPAAIRRIAAAMLADCVATLSADPPTKTNSSARRRAARTWYEDAVCSVLWLHSPALAVWCDAAGIEPEIFVAECAHRGLIRDPWADVAPIVRTALGGRPVIFDDPEKERRLVRVLAGLGRKEAAA